MVTTHNLGLAKIDISQSQKQSSQTVLHQDQLKEISDFVSVGCSEVPDPMVTMMDLLGHQSQYRHFKAYQEAKWFDSNKHYVVPEITQNTRFTLDASSLINEITLAKQQGFNVKPILIGPISYLWFSGAKGNVKKLDLLESLLPIYAELLEELNKAGVDWVQFDEPVLTRKLDNDWKHALLQAYFHLQRSPTKKLLANTFGKLGDNLSLLRELTVDGVHLDTISAEDEALKVADWLPNYKIISLAVVDGSQSSTVDIEDTLAWLKPIHELIGSRLWLAPSSSLAHLPKESNNSSMLDIAKQKLDEVKLLAAILDNVSVVENENIDAEVNEDDHQEFEEHEEHKVAA